MKIAIVIPAYNCRGTISETLESLQRVCLGWEHVAAVIVCDDASTDDTVEVVKASMFDRCRLQLLRHETNRGEGACYGTMVAALSADVNWLLILHSDDLVLENFLTRNVEIARRCPERTAAVSSNYYVFSGSDERLAHIPPQDLIVWRGGKTDEITHTAVAGTWWHISGSLVNRILWEKFGGRDPCLPQLGDWDLMLRWQKNDYLVGHSLIPTTKYRLTSGSVSAQSYLQFRDLLERVTVITRHPTVFTRRLRLRAAWSLALQATRRTVKLTLAGKLNYALRGALASATCIFRLSFPSA